MNTNEKRLLDLLKTASVTDEAEIDCDEFLNRVAAYIENADTDLDLSKEFWEVAKHIQVCSECREEFDALVELHRSE